MTILKRISSTFTAILVTVAILMGLNGAELGWIKLWQGDTDQAVRQSRVASQLTVAVEDMIDTLYELPQTVAAGSGSAGLGTTFANDSAAAARALETMLADAEPGSEQAATVEHLKSLLDDLKQDGNALLASADDYGAGWTGFYGLSSTIANAIGSSADNLLHEAKSYMDGTEAQITERLDSLGFVATMCIIATAVLGVGTVLCGGFFGWTLTRKVGRSLREATNSISTSAAELMAVASQVAASAAQTAASTSETTVTVEEVKQTAVLAHEKSSQAAQGAQRAREMYGSTRSLTDETVSAMERMQGQMDVVSQTIDRLGDQTQAAGDVIALVNDLAEQSNLLSVNASIEAAKAGEYGKGFTVVAQQVKSLAEQSKQAVAQVRAMLSESQKAGQMAVQAAAHGREAVEAARQQSLEASEVMQQLVEGATDDLEASQQVAASSQQQLAGMEQIAQAIESINEAGGQSATGTRQVEQEVGRLQELAVQLRSLVEAHAESNDRDTGE